MRPANSSQQVWYALQETLKSAAGPKRRNIAITVAALCSSTYLIAYGDADAPGETESGAAMRPASMARLVACFGSLLACAVQKTTRVTAGRALDTKAARAGSLQKHCWLKGRVVVAITRSGRRNSFGDQLGGEEARQGAARGVAGDRSGVPSALR